MTTAQRMLAVALPPRAARWALVASAAVALTGCESRPKTVMPRSLTAPAYFDPSRRDEPIWAVAPLRNESGVSLVDPLAVTDTLAGQVHQVDGVNALPLNRTLAAMRALRMESIETLEDAATLLDALGADALIVGTITAWDPYNPPKIGMSLLLFVRGGSAMAGPAASLASAGDTPDPVILESSAIEVPVASASWTEGPASTASSHLDAASNATRAMLQEYGEGRSETVSALGWRRYLASMPLYAEFACYRLVEQLLDAERRRLAGWTDNQKR